MSVALSRSSFCHGGNDEMMIVGADVGDLPTLMIAGVTWLIVSPTVMNDAETFTFPDGQTYYLRTGASGT